MNTARDTVAQEAGQKLPPITLGVMQLVVTDIAADIEDGEARMAVTLRKRPDPAKLEQARVLRKIAELVDRLKANPAALVALGLKPASE